MLKNKLNMIYVLETRGKHESVDSVIVHSFQFLGEAEDYIKEHNAPDEKYYRCLEIIETGKLYNVHGSRGEDYPAEINKDY